MVEQVFNLPIFRTRQVEDLPHVILATRNPSRDKPPGTMLNHLLQEPQSLLQDLLLNQRTRDGHWEGLLSESALATATAISTFSFYLQSRVADSGGADLDLMRKQVIAGIGWLIEQQNEDGGWGDTPKNDSNISTSMLVIAALNAADQADEFSGQLARAASYVESEGGIPGLKKRYGRDKTFAVPILANCAMAGVVPWSEVSALPFEAAVVPQRFYHLMQLPVVSYAIPALVAIGQAKFHFDPPWDPVRKTIRRLSIEPGLNVLQKMQPASGGYLEAIPLTSFVSMALIRCGRADHPVVRKGIEFLLNSFRVDQYKPDAQASGSAEPPSLALRACIGTWPIDTNLATWNTSLSINALANDSNSFKQMLEADSELWRQCLDWLLSCQNTEKHPFTGATPGGWGWSDLSGAVPDADDTPGAMLALRRIHEASPRWLDRQTKQRISVAAISGANWLLGLQNRDGGWPTFCRGWGKLPFDRSGSDITAHVIRGLLAWQHNGQAIEKGFRYLQKQQRTDGSWLPLWFGNQDQPDDENPFYGTAKVLMAYRDAGRNETSMATAGYKWLVEHQNVDGGWGGSDSNGSSVEETALCVEALAGCNYAGAENATNAGLAWLIEAIKSERVENSSPIGFYFAKLWYYEKLYPLIFAAGALNRASFEQSGCSVDDV
jgi:squalene-hopene/tetraprenyl-beta-curcumene cyclase